MLYVDTKAETSTCHLLQKQSADGPITTLTQRDIITAVHIFWPNIGVT